jgi:nucleotide-binding universal stress UspA family protein
MHQGGIEEILFGSTAEKVLRAARIPVMCVPPARAQLNQDASQ